MENQLTEIIYLSVRILPLQFIIAVSVVFIAIGMVFIYFKDN